MQTDDTGVTVLAPASTPNHRVVSRDAWIAERRRLLACEKELTRLGDEIARERRALPFVRIDKTYIFDTPAGPRGLADLFEGRRQLLVQHFMLAPGWQQGGKNCSYMADPTDGATAHLAQRDVPEIERFRRRMGWQFPWVSSHGTDFNRDFHVTFTADERGAAQGCTTHPHRLQHGAGRQCPASFIGRCCGADIRIFGRQGNTGKISDADQQCGSRCAQVTRCSFLRTSRRRFPRRRGHATSPQSKGFVRRLPLYGLGRVPWDQVPETEAAAS